MKNKKREIIERLLKGKGNSLRRRVDANCVSCIYDDLAKGTWRRQVERCAVTTCALYDVRPTPRTSMVNERTLSWVEIETLPSEMQKEGHKKEPRIESGGQHALS